MRLTLPSLAALRWRRRRWRRRSPSSSSTPTRASSPSGGRGRRSRPNFEAVCDCTVRFVGAGDGAALLGRLRLEGARTPGGHRARARHQPDGARRRRPGSSRRTGSRRRRSTCRSPGTTRSSCPTTGATSPSSTTRTRMPEPPASFEELIASDAQHRHPRPAQLDAGARAADVGQGRLWRPGAGDLGGAARRTSSPWRRAGPRPTGCSSNGEVDMALAYTTSPAYHLIAEDDDSKARGDVRRGPLHAGRGGGDDRGLGPAGAGAGVPARSC